jgi:hypothetical protein
MVRLAFFILVLTVPFSASAQSVGGNLLIGRQPVATVAAPSKETI